MGEFKPSEFHSNEMNMLPNFHVTGDQRFMSFCSAWKHFRCK